uniref:Uncharacterized protein n=1 Tax=Arundo donax TaxID=35708 RepID=A0A0A9H135_ARUDO
MHLSGPTRMQSISIRSTIMRLAAS